MPLITREHRADFLATVWSIGFCCYAVFGLLLLAMAPILIPWLAALLVVACVLIHLAVIDTDENFLIGCAVLQVALAWGAGQLAVGAPPRGPETLSMGVFILSVLVPVASGVLAVRRSRPVARR